jgi:hypothetical protein
MLLIEKKIIGESIKLIILFSIFIHTIIVSYKIIICNYDS